MWNTGQIKTLLSTASSDGDAVRGHSLERTVESLVINAKHKGMPPCEFLKTVRNWAVSERDWDENSVRVKLAILRAVEASVVRQYNIAQTAQRHYR